MNIAIIGTGNVAQALSGTIRRAGHEVTVAARDSDRTRQVADELGARAAGSPAEAAAGAEIIVLAVPYGALTAVAAELGSSADGKVVIDVTNPPTPDFSGLATEGGSSAAEQLAGMLAGARVVKAFNTVFGALQADPETYGRRIDALYATDDDEARHRVARFIRSLGFRPVDAGPLEAARQMEALAWLNMRLQMLHGGDWRSTFVLLGAPEGAIPAEREQVLAGV